MTFDLQEIRMDISDGLYLCIGCGSGRQVFDLNNGYVVKAAKNRKGVAQNKVEQYISRNSRINLLAEVVMVSEDFSLLIMEKAQKLTDIHDVWDFFRVTSNKELLQHRDVKRLYTKYRLLPRDLLRACNWGRIGDDIVIIDYGFTLEVRMKYY